MARTSKQAASIGDDLPDAGPNRDYGRLQLSPSLRRDRAAVTVNLAESSLGWMARRGHVTPRQLEAGERLRADFERAQLAPSVTMRWDAAPTSRTARAAPLAFDASSAQLAAKERFAAAVDSVGPGLSDILWRVVCAGESMTAAERALQWPVRAGKVVLCLALDRLANHYRVS